MKHFIIFLFIIPICLITRAQLGATRDQVIQDEGTKYTAAISDAGQPYLSYHSANNYTGDKEIMCHVVYYFNPTSGICEKVMFCRPIEEINDWVKSLNSRAVSTGDLAWKDYQRNWEYHINKDLGDEIIILITPFY